MLNKTNEKEALASIGCQRQESAGRGQKRVYKRPIIVKITGQDVTIASLQWGGPLNKIAQE